MKLVPSIAILTNVEAEHLDVYKDLSEIQQVFAEFAGKVRPGGSLIAHSDESVDRVLGLAHLADDVTVIRYGPGTEYSPEIVPTLTVIGWHQRENAAAVLAAADTLGYERSVVLDALAKFPGVGRRLEYIGERDGVRVYDDYGHHPTEVAATLRALHESFPDHRLVVAFQPHQHSRVHALFDEFATCFRRADLLLLTDIYEVPGRDESVRVRGEALRDAIESSGTNVKYLGSLEQLLAHLHEYLKPGDVFVTMGATNITNVGRTWVKDGGGGYVAA